MHNKVKITLKNFSWQDYIKHNQFTLFLISYTLISIYRVKTFVSFVHSINEEYQDINFLRILLITIYPENYISKITYGQSPNAFIL